jgi:hypothetical protein
VDAKWLPKQNGIHFFREIWMPKKAGIHRLIDFVRGLGFQGASLTIILRRSSYVQIIDQFYVSSRIS